MEQVKPHLPLLYKRGLTLEGNKALENPLLGEGREQYRQRRKNLGDTGNDKDIDGRYTKWVNDKRTRGRCKSIKNRSGDRNANRWIFGFRGTSASLRELYCCQPSSSTWTLAQRGQQLFIHWVEVKTIGLPN
jgi:hypothetical protein